MTAIVLVPLVWGCGTPKEDDEPTVQSAGASLGVEPETGAGAGAVVRTVREDTGGGISTTIGGDPPRLPDDALYVQPDGEVDVPADTRGVVPTSPVSGGVEVDGCAAACIEAEFIRGYTEAGGDLGLLAHFTGVVIPCESRWNPHAVSAGGHLGLAQFAADSWAKAGGGDWRSPYQQGRNVAYWASITDPASQWSCW